MVLAESGKSSLLVKYSYHGFKADLVRVLEFKARNADLRHPQHRKYYELLFSFHVTHKVAFQQSKTGQE